MSLIGRHPTLIVKNKAITRNIVIETTIFLMIGKKNSQLSVSDADQQISTLGSTDNSRNSVDIVSTIICLPLGWDFFFYMGDR